MRQHAFHPSTHPPPVRVLPAVVAYLAGCFICVCACVCVLLLYLTACVVYLSLCLCCLCLSPCLSVHVPVVSLCDGAGTCIVSLSACVRAPQCSLSCVLVLSTLLTCVSVCLCYWWFSPYVVVSICICPSACLLSAPLPFSHSIMQRIRIVRAGARALWTFLSFPP